MNVEYSIATEKSNSRQNNEDAATFIANQDGVILCALCDGMGGHSKGEIASNLTLDYLKEEFLNTKAKKFQNVDQWIRQTITKIQTKLAAYIVSHPECEDMGTTLVGAIIFSEKTYIFNIGDSRAYFVNDVFVKQLTEDQNLKNYAKTQNIDLEILLNANSSVLVSSLGPKKDYIIDIYTFDNKVGFILLCSDGFYNFTSNTTLIATAMRPNSIHEKATELLNYIRNKTDDNATIVLVRLSNEDAK